MDNKEIGKRIKKARDLRNMTLDAVADDIGVAKSTVQRYEAGKIDKIKMPVLSAIANSLRVNPAWIAGKSNDIELLKIKASKGIKIPVLGRVAAGIPIEAVEDIIDEEEISDSMARTGSFFGLRITGDSMEPRICEGDVIIVRKQDDAESGDTVVALINGHDAACKRLIKYADGIRLMSTNPKYEPLYFTNDEIISIPVEIIGKVVENRQKY